MNNDLTNKAVVDTGHSAAAAKQKNISGQKKNSAIRKNTDIYKKAIGVSQSAKKSGKSSVKTESKTGKTEKNTTQKIAEEDEFDAYDITPSPETAEQLAANDGAVPVQRKRQFRIMKAVPIAAAAVILAAGVIISSAALGIFDAGASSEYVATQQSSSVLKDPKGKYLSGISVAGIDLGGKTMAEALELLSSEEEKLIPSINYNLKCEDKLVYLTEDDFDFRFDTIKRLNEAYEYSEFMRTYLTEKGRASLKKFEKKDFDIKMVLDEKSIRKTCAETAIKVDAEMQNAHVTNIDTSKEKIQDMFSFEEGVVGYKIDVDDLANQIITLKKKNIYEANIVGKMTVEEPTTNIDDLLKNLVMISHYQTFSGNTWAGNMNMTVAMQSMTGTVIKPGEVFSFNEKTGDSNDPDNGYYAAGVIVNGAEANGIGGGICQAATTIYNAAIRSGMTIVEREPHTWPSVYVPVGTDSAIDYGFIDMKFRNDTDHEVYLICYMDGGTLNAFIYGYKPSAFDEITVSSWYTGGSSIGFGASACRNYIKNGKVVKKEDLPDSFYANGGGSSYPIEEEAKGYVYERVYTDKQAAKLAEKIKKESAVKSTKTTKEAPVTTKDKKKNEDSDKKQETSETESVSVEDEAVYTDAPVYTEENEASEDIQYEEPEYIEEETVYEDNSVSENYSEETYYEDGNEELSEEE